MCSWISELLRVNIDKAAYIGAGKDKHLSGWNKNLAYDRARLKDLWKKLVSANFFPAEFIIIKLSSKSKISQNNNVILI